MVDGSSRLEIGNTDIPVLFFSSDGMYEKQLVSPLVLSHVFQWYPK